MLRIIDGALRNEATHGNWEARRDTLSWYGSGARNGSRVRERSPTTTRSSSSSTASAQLDDVRAASFFGICVVCLSPTLRRYGRSRIELPRLGSFELVGPMRGLSGPTMDAWRRSGTATWARSALLRTLLEPLVEGGVRGGVLRVLGRQDVAAAGPTIDEILDVPLASYFPRTVDALMTRRVTDPSSGYAWRSAAYNACPTGSGEMGAARRAGLLGLSWH